MRFLNIFIFLFFSVVSITEELTILEYKLGGTTDEFPCEFKFYDNWFLDEYYCEIRRSEYDQVKVFSDKWTYLVGTIERYILIDETEKVNFEKKLFKTYGPPKQELFERGSKHNKFMIWGDAEFDVSMQRKEDFGTKFYSSSFLPYVEIEENKIAMEIRIVSCGKSFSLCSDIFKVKDNEKIMYEFTLINDQVRSINSQAFLKEKDPRIEEPKKIIKTKKASEIEI